MHKLDNLENKALLKYFSTLSVLGYINDNLVYRLLTLDYINYILHHYYPFIDNANYRIIMNVLDCLYGDCIISYEEYLNTVPTEIKDKVASISEEEALNAIKIRVPNTHNYCDRPCL